MKAIAQRPNLQYRRGRPAAVGGFTLIELLVVVAVITLLVAILMPSLSGARAQAQRLKCLSMLRQFQMGSMNYANEWNEYYLPVRATDDQGLHSWDRHRVLREYIGIKQELDPARNLAFANGGAARATFICPNATYGLDHPIAFATVRNMYSLYYSYGINYTGKETGIANADPFVGFRRITMANPSGTLAFADAIDQLINYSGSASYVGEMDGNGTVATAYRHNNGANVVYFDGHGDGLPRKNLDKNYGAAVKTIWTIDSP